MARGAPAEKPSSSRTGFALTIASDKVKERV
jgi:hypothetical protein